MNEFLERYKEQLGEEFNEFKDYLDFKPKQSIRVNTLKISEKELIRRLKEKGVELRKVDWLDYGYIVDKTPFNLVSSPEYLQGYFFIQELASQLPVQVLSPDRRELVLDCCAAPGAKTTQIAQYMGNKGKLVALDMKKERIFALRNNLERCGVKNTLVYNFDSRELEKLKLEFDKILVDAPCSGNFVLNKDWFKKRKLKDVRYNTKKQKSILKSALNCLKKGGILVYSTCSLEPEEDEEIVQWMKDSYDVKVSGCTKLWPHKSKTQGFFVAKLQKI
ncbi:RsmB/NOP family class I SAM-dependent RNA methyltransferase [Candidatus Woesearchaeota archaeon]|nr:RsmB/NOP family class I SAM-dependent RNA methyltransferase [Candidatus Woesearchaeota archaeon]